MMKSTSFETGSTLVRISHIPIEDGEPFGELIEISANLKCKNHTCMQLGFLTDLYNGESTL